MSKLEAKRLRYHIFKDDLRMGVVCETRATAYEFIEERVIADHPELSVFMLLIGINKRYRRHYTIVTAVGADNVKLVTYKIVPETVHIRMTDAVEGDFKSREDES